MAPQSVANVKFAMFMTRGSLADAFPAAIDAPWAAVRPPGEAGPRHTGRGSPSMERKLKCGKPQRRCAMAAYNAGSVSGFQRQTP